MESTNGTGLRMLVGCLGIAFLMPSFAQGFESTDTTELPVGWIAEYDIRENPNDENSAVLFVVRLRLRAEDWTDDSLGWSVQKIEFEQLDAYGNVEAAWVESNPVLDTVDGLWWTDHVNLSHPTSDEFAKPPTLEGTAAYAGGAFDDLDYFFEAGDCNPTCQAMFGGNVTALRIAFQEVGATAPMLENDDDEPVEVHGEQGSPE